MPALSETATTILVKRGKSSSVEGIEQAYSAIAELCEDRIHWGDPKTLDEKTRRQKQALVLRQASVHRMMRLLRSFGAVVEQHDPYGLSLVTRGALETTCQIGYFCDRLDALEKGHIDLANFSEKLGAALAGTKTLAGEGNDIPPINVLSYVEKADKFAAVHLGGDPPAGFLSDAYATLSEVCHPNFSSSASAFWIDKDAHDFVFRHDDEMDDLNLNDVHLFAATAASFLLFVRAYSKKLTQLD